MSSPGVARRSKPPCGVAGFPWNQWQLSPGIGGSFAMESVATFVWNRWQLCYGISGSFPVESVAGLAWNTHRGTRPHRGSCPSSLRLILTVSWLQVRSYWIPGSYAPGLSEKRNSFSGLLKNKGFKEERKTKVGLDAIDKSTTLESNKSQIHWCHYAQRQVSGAAWGILKRSPAYSRAFNL